MLFELRVNNSKQLKFFKKTIKKTHITQKIKNKFTDIIFILL